MVPAEGELGDAAWEHKEQLFLLEVLVDKVVIEEPEESRYSCESPTFNLIGKAAFLNLPELEIEPNALAARAGVDLGQEKLRIPGLPEEWEVTPADDLVDYGSFPQYRVMMNVDDVEKKRSFIITVLVPRIAVEAGEGLRYTFTALERKVNSHIMSILKKQFREALEKEIGKKDTPEPIIFSAGKSCLFQMTPLELITSLKRYPSYVLIYRQGVVDGIPLTHMIGKVRLHVSIPFSNAILESQGASVLPVSAHLEREYPMQNLFGQKSGTIWLFVRLSCFGFSMGRPVNCLAKGTDAVNTEEEKSPKRVRSAMTVLDDTLVAGGACSMDATVCEEERVHITWRRAHDIQPLEFTPLLRELMPVLRTMPPPPPRETPPPDPWSSVTVLPRCAPGVKPPCFRRPGDMPVPKCKIQAESQLRREELTKAQQTDAVFTAGRLPSTSPYVDKSLPTGGLDKTLYLGKTDVKKLQTDSQPPLSRLPASALYVDEAFSSAKLLAPNSKNIAG